MSNSTIFCLCKAMCLPDDSSASKAAKNRLKWKKFNYNIKDEHPLPPIFALLIDLYDGKDVYEDLESCRINPDYISNRTIRNDLEFYIPQLTNFMVFHTDFAQDRLYQFFEQWSKADLYFAHLYYWYISSLSNETQHLRVQEIIKNFINESYGENITHFFDSDYQRFFAALHKKMTAGNVRSVDVAHLVADYDLKMESINERRMKTNEKILAYKDQKLAISSEILMLKASDLELKPYSSPFAVQEDLNVSNPFTSTLLFFEDLIFTAEHVIKAPYPLTALKKLLNLINKAILPSYVYIPFVKDSIRQYTVLNIVVEETKVFSTKERAPFYICLELYRPRKELVYEYNNLFKLEETKDIKSERNTNFLQWAKKKLHIGDGKPKVEHQRPFLPDSKLQEFPEEDFKLSKLDEIVSLPMTLKVHIRYDIFSNLQKHQRNSGSHHSLPNIDVYDTRGIEQRLSQSLILTDHTKTDNIGIFIDQNHNEKVSDTTSNNVLSAKHLGINSNTSDTGNYQSQNNQQSDPSQDEKNSDLISARRRNSIRKSPLIIPKLTTDACPLEPLEEEAKGTGTSRDLEKSTAEKSDKNIKEIKNMNEYFFGEDSEIQAQRIRKHSLFGSLKTWRLVHLIVKSGADMKEEQFAIQLITEFERIFKVENLKLILSSYEILSLGDNVGLVEVVKDAITMSKLKEKMYNAHIPTLNDFFMKFYGKNVEDARKQFCRSLAAYSLVCYFLQIKDRHNGNIMLHKDGHIIHIDFGFFLSNSPGKGIEFEKKIPFKLLNEYIEVLGGPRSKLFQKFRSLFYKFNFLSYLTKPNRGFLAARKHKEQILILVKMVYSSQSQSFPCFKTGIKAIQDLEQRFYPANVSEGRLKEYCFNLINQSLDNWRAKCYDKYQYYFQGIFY